jgi:hypothetical protein
VYARALSFLIACRKPLRLQLHKHQQTANYDYGGIRALPLPRDLSKPGKLEYIHLRVALAHDVSPFNTDESIPFQNDWSTGRPTRTPSQESMDTTTYSDSTCKEMQQLTSSELKVALPTAEYDSQAVMGSFSDFRSVGVSDFTEDQVLPAPEGTPASWQQELICSSPGPELTCRSPGPEQMMHGNVPCAATGTWELVNALRASAAYISQLQEVQRHVELRLEQSVHEIVALRGSLNEAQVCNLGCIRHSFCCMCQRNVVCNMTCARQSSTAC